VIFFFFFLDFADLDFADVDLADADFADVDFALDFVALGFFAAVLLCPTMPAGSRKPEINRNEMNLRRAT
jgi:hypothetical protein